MGKYLNKFVNSKIISDNKDPKWFDSTNVNKYKVAPGITVYSNSGIYSRKGIYDGIEYTITSGDNVVANWNKNKSHKLEALLAFIWNDYSFIGINREFANITSDEVLNIIIGHEIGHKKNRDLNYVVENNLYDELLADCWGIHIANQINKKSLSNLAIEYKEFFQDFFEAVKIVKKKPRNVNQNIEDEIRIDFCDWLGSVCKNMYKPEKYGVKNFVDWFFNNKKQYSKYKFVNLR